MQGESGGGVVSLAERQLEVLRARNEDLHERMAELVANARANERVFSRTRAFVLALMDASDEIELDRALEVRLVRGFGVDDAVCLVRDWSSGAELSHIAGVESGTARASCFDHVSPMCGVYRPDEYRALFDGSELNAPGSAALIPLQRDGGPVNALLAVGAKDVARFTPDMGLQFLSFWGDVMSRTLARLGIGQSR